MHFPWCLAKCPYCDFVSYAKPRDAIDHEGYADAVIRELDARAATFSGRTVASVFFGGGTPSLWSPDALGRVLGALKNRLNISSDLEVTVECNPTSFDRARADALAAVGVNRVSIGTQSLRPEQLDFLGRLHDPEGALDAVRDALASDLPRVSTDIIFGLPGQSPDDARAQASFLADLGLRHLSCYQLTIEPGTRFGELARRGRLPLADDGAVAEGFAAIEDTLASRGFGHYEISNYAVQGEEARHNLGYWRGEEYLGLGCAAYGFVRNDSGGVRWRNPPDPAKYMAQGTAAASTEPLDAAALLRERIMLGLRTAEGVDLDAAGVDLGIAPWTREREAEVARLIERGRLTRDGGTLRIPARAWVLADDTIARLF